MKLVKRLKCLTALALIVPAGCATGGTKTLGTTVEAKNALRFASVKGPAGYANQSVVDLFRDECAESPAKPTKAATTKRVGNQNPPKLGAIPTDDIFVWTEGDAEYLDPNLISESAGVAIASQMFETLLITAPGNTKPHPGMAEKFERSRDGKTYTFHVRKAVVWSDGKPFNAHDFKYAWLRALNPKTRSKNAQQLWYIKGAKAYNTSEVKTAEKVGVRVVGDHTLVVELEKPANYFPDLVTQVAFAPVPRHAIEKHGERWTLPENLVVNGPFYMTEWTPRTKIVLKKNPKYWDRDEVKLKGSVILLGDSSEKNLRYYKSGVAHAAKPVPPDVAREALGQGRSDLKIDTLMCTYYYVMRLTKPPFDNPLVRRAMTMAIDRKALTEQVLGLAQLPATTVLPNLFAGSIGYTTSGGDGYNPVEAARLLAKAGYPGGRGLPAIEMIYNTYESHRLIAVFVQRSLKKNLGIEVSIDHMEWKSLLKRQHSGDFQMARTSWCADYPDPLTFLEIFSSNHANNYAAYKNAAYDRLIGEIERETDPAKRNASICAAEKVLNRDLPVIPFYFYTRAYLLRPFVKGYEPQYQDQHLLKYISIERQGPEPK